MTTSPPANTYAAATMTNLDARSPIDTKHQHVTRRSASLTLGLAVSPRVPAWDLSSRFRSPPQVRCGLGGVRYR
eukprot:CAMPEP_0183341432 /NCGR_PEP_ID=MMETSP0164_2-20130417/7695_1 /TAXON_ID=221442 /ORGANISM="Coccolithus pelagicus ssp braarudi, Strain PLY182g" /LENGTH=73 /DNA_ID=CAMNT_0025511749 /DNA_START=144 /DNA_END=361 /DNA_ORIENTATION=-